MRKLFLIGAVALAIAATAWHNNHMTVSDIIGPAAAQDSAMDSLQGFNDFFRKTIAQAKHNNVKIDQFSNEGEVGWEQVLVVDNNVVRITVFVAPPSTFAIKHLCIGQTDSQPKEMTCITNLGEMWVETKNNKGDWDRAQSKELPWARNVSKFAFD